MESFVANSLSVFDNRLLIFVLFCYLAIATYTDLKYLKIYNKFNMSLVLTRVIFIFLPVYGVRLQAENILASMIVFITMLSIGVILMHKMGGDIKFITAFMLFFDIKFMIVFMAIASLVNLMYLMILKKILLNKNKKNIEEIAVECENNKRRMNIKDKITYGIIKMMVVKSPRVEELISMNEKDFKKYRVPFAPFFLISYLILLTVYFLNN